MEAKKQDFDDFWGQPNSGKTFVSSNLAAIIAQTGKKVLFIDTDMRKGIRINYSMKIMQMGCPISFLGKQMSRMLLKSYCCRV